MENNNNNITLCPRCNQMMVSTEKFCKSCGFVIESETSQNVEKLQFGKKEPTDATVTSSIRHNEFKQEKTPIINKIKNIQNYIYLFIGVLSILMIVIPLFSNINVYSQCYEMALSYGFVLPETFSLDNKDNLISLFANIISFKNYNQNVLNAASIVYVYNIVTAIITLAIASMGCVLFSLSLSVILKKKKNNYFKKLVGYILTLSMIMIFGLNCFGVGPILLALLCTLCLIFLYIGGIISNEKQFLLKQLIFKAISISLLIVIITFSSIGLINLNIHVGAPLYNFSDYPSKGDLNPNRISAHGIFLEIAQFIQCSSGDDVFTTFTFIVNILSFVFHSIYLIFAILAVVSLFKSLSKQSISFPISKVMISTAIFYLFAIVMLLFNQLINEAALNKFIAQIGIANYTQLSSSNQLKIEKAYKVFALKPGLIVSMILYFPTCIFTVYSNKVCLKKDY